MTNGYLYATILTLLYFTNHATFAFIAPYKCKIISDQLYRESGTTTAFATTAVVYDSLSSNKEDDVDTQVETIRRDFGQALQKHDYNSAYSQLESLALLLSRPSSEQSQRTISHTLDILVQQFTTATFSQRHHYRNKQHQQRVVGLGIQAMRLQLDTPGLSRPYNSVPKRTIVNALQAITSTDSTRSKSSIIPHHTIQSNAVGNDWNVILAYRLLQRLITGAGIRQKSIQQLHEKNFCLVLHAFTRIGRMEMAERVKSLQERSTVAPPLSAVPFSILIKGYGKLKSLERVEATWNQAVRQDSVDVILVNSILDAYISCNALAKAQEIYDRVMTGDIAVLPNQRTYNTMLKGFANAGMLDDAMDLVTRVNSDNKNSMWDAVTTNTLVHAAILAGDYDYAEELLTEHTVNVTSLSMPASATIVKRASHHPNVEAYTELIDAYCKKSDLDSAWSIYRLMKDRNVNANSYTYTCLIAGLARDNQINKSLNVLKHMSRQTGIRPTVVTYNALLSAILESMTKHEADDAKSHDSVVMRTDSVERKIDQGLKAFADMIQTRVVPNTVTMTTLIDLLGHSRDSRVEEAQKLIDMLQKQHDIDFTADTRVMTALIQAYGRNNKLSGAVDTFRSIDSPDLVAVNTLLDACSRCGRGDVARELFDHYFVKKVEKYRLKPDVISFSVLIADLLKECSTANCIHANKLYLEMTKTWNIDADTTMIDMILKAILRKGRTGRLSTQITDFIEVVMKDAKKLEWLDGQLDKRKRAVSAMLSHQKHSYESSYLGAEYEDELFRKKGWNHVDSSFRMIGGRGTKSSDKFLQSKGWNDVDSGFRII